MEQVAYNAKKCAKQKGKHRKQEKKTNTARG